MQTCRTQGQAQDSSNTYLMMTMTMIKMMIIIITNIITEFRKHFITAHTVTTQPPDSPPCLLLCRIIHPPFFTHAFHVCIHLSSALVYIHTTEAHMNHITPTERCSSQRALDSKNTKQ